MGLVAAIREILKRRVKGPNPRARKPLERRGRPRSRLRWLILLPGRFRIRQTRRERRSGMTSTVEVTGRDRERAVKAYVKLLEEEGYWVKPGPKWDPTDPSISI